MSGSCTGASGPWRPCTGVRGLNKLLKLCKVSLRIHHCCTHWLEGRPSVLSDCFLLFLCLSLLFCLFGFYPLLLLLLGVPFPDLSLPISVLVVKKSLVDH